VSDVTIFSRVLSLASSSERIRLSYLGISSASTTLFKNRIKLSTS